MYTYMQLLCVGITRCPRAVWDIETSVYPTWQMHLQGLSKVFSQEETKKWMEVKQFRSEKKQILTVKWKMRWKKLLAIFIAYILIILFALLLKISSIVYKEGWSMSASNKLPLHFLNFPTISSLLHIRTILVHWPLFEISGPQKWVVGATLALKQNFLAGTLKMADTSLISRVRTTGRCYPPRPSASVENTFLDLLNSSYPTQPHSLIAKYWNRTKRIS